VRRGGFSSILKFVKFTYELKNMLLHIFRLEAKATFSPVEAPAQINAMLGHFLLAQKDLRKRVE
jgi:hypothetical protein